MIKIRSIFSRTNVVNCWSIALDTIFVQKYRYKNITTDVIQRTSKIISLYQKYTLSCCTNKKFAMAIKRRFHSIKIQLQTQPLLGCQLESVYVHLKAPEYNNISSQLGNYICIKLYNYHFPIINNVDLLPCIVINQTIKNTFDLFKFIDTN